MKNLHIYILSFLSFVCYSGIAQEKIDENLLAQLKTKQAEEQVSFIVMLNDQVELAELKKNQEKLSRQQIHEQVVTMLQNKAKSTQQDFVSYLNMQKKRGDIISFEPLWIINAVLVKAKAKTVVEISQHKDIAYVYLDYLITSIRPTKETKTSMKAAGGVEDGVLLINADCLWAQGITGAGRLVSHLDTGVDGNHPALAAKWRGNTASAAESWFDPNGLSPNFPIDSGSHGTHTMGTILGSVPGDIIGVAYDSEWISAGVIDIGGISNTISNALLAFQWTADPDGNPATVNDVPDVSSNSWGLLPFVHVPSACDITFWSAIDNLEAATVVVVFAAGNEGANGSSTLRTPSDRATTFNNSFSVGALDATGTTIAFYSSRGPSTCTTNPTMAIKPEVVARGSSVRSSFPGGGYGLNTGTSMAAPHVAGAVALLRQVNPNATVDQIKDALIQSAIDLGANGEDNNYGHGLIDVCAAAQILAPPSCPVTLNIAANVPSGTDTKEASSNINAFNTISSPATGIYHAGDEVLLTVGFDALNGSTFRAYIEGCTGSFVSRNSDNSIAYIDQTPLQDTADAITVQKMHIAPNPNKGAFSVYFDEEESGTLQVLDFKGDLIKTLEFQNSTKLSVDIQRNLQGMYFVKIRTKSRTFVEKIIKK